MALNQKNKPRLPAMLDALDRRYHSCRPGLPPDICDHSFRAAGVTSVPSAKADRSKQRPTSQSRRARVTHFKTFKRCPASHGQQRGGAQRPRHGARLRHPNPAFKFEGRCIGHLRLGRDGWRHQHHHARGTGTASTRFRMAAISDPSCAATASSRPASPPPNVDNILKLQKKTGQRTQCVCPSHSAEASCVLNKA